MFGSRCNRCPHSAHVNFRGITAQGCDATRVGVQSWWSKDLLSWQTAKVDGTLPTYNVQVAAVPGPSPAALPPHRYVMIMEPFTFAVNNNQDGNLAMGWILLNITEPKAPSGGPSIRYNHLDSKYYVITGGHTGEDLTVTNTNISFELTPLHFHWHPHAPTCTIAHAVDLVRTADFHTWESSPNSPFVAPHSYDANVSSYAGFPAVAKDRGFLPMHADYTKWDWNSNDADVCCMTDQVNDRSGLIRAVSLCRAMPCHAMPCRVVLPLICALAWLWIQFSCMFTDHEFPLALKGVRDLRRGYPRQAAEAPSHEGQPLHQRRCSGERVASAPDGQPFQSVSCEPRPP